MAAKNCWEHKRCGREPSVPKVAELGVCPVTTFARTNGINHGQNGGSLLGNQRYALWWQSPRHFRLEDDELQQVRLLRVRKGRGRGRVREFIDIS
jgi:hypothetical protein